VTATDAHRTIEAIWRIESVKLIAGLARMVRDVGLAEDFAQDALVAALERWPETGVPDKPGAWLMATAKRRAIDSIVPSPPSTIARSAVPGSASSGIVSTSVMPAALAVSASSDTACPRARRNATSSASGAFTAGPP